MQHESDRPFFADGLRFDCTRCQRCCRLEPGFVFLSADDVARLAEHLQLSTHQVRERYCRVVDAGGIERLSLQEQANYDCVFWGNGGCNVYEARPLQCRSFPFWPGNVDSQQGWDEVAGQCPGVGRGPLHSGLEIAYWLGQRAAEPLLDGADDEDGADDDRRS